MPPVPFWRETIGGAAALASMVRDLMRFMIFLLSVLRKG
jgi:hypothetical protein